MANLEQLIAGHAYWSDRKKELQAQFASHLSNCDGDHLSFTTVNCFRYAYQVLNDINSDHDCYYGTGVASFWEIWAGHHADTNGNSWQPCEHCKLAHDVRLEKVNAAQHLGSIRAAMTRVGRAIEYKAAK